MSSKEKKESKKDWLVGGCFMLGLGIGFFILPYSIWAFIGSIISGIGIGLIVGAIVDKKF